MPLPRKPIPKKSGIPRRVNDAQSDRFLRDLKDPKYLASVARAAAGIEPGQVISQLTKEKQTAYKSARRRFERYVTDATEKRSFKRAPLPYKREARAIARKIPRPVQPKAKPKPKPEPKPKKKVPRLIDYGYEIEPAPLPYNEPLPEFPTGRAISNADLVTFVAFHDGDTKEASKELKMGRVGSNLLEMATSGVDIAGYVSQDSDKLKGSVADWFDRLDDDVLEDVNRFSELMENLPEWERKMILDDLETGETTFEDWIDAYRADGFRYRGFNEKNPDLIESEFWALWRDMYARSK